jgi:hypothetical protein
MRRQKMERTRRLRFVAGLVVSCAVATTCGSAQPVRIVGATQPEVVSSPVETTETAAVVVVTEPSKPDGALGAALAVHASAGPRATIYGRAGTFGNVINEPGSRDRTVAVDGWGFLPGQSAYFTAVDARGRVLIANQPQTDNQTLPTAVTMAVSVFDPSTNVFSNVLVPTSTGAQSAVALDGSGVGGADVSDLQLIDGPDGQSLVLTSVAPYNGWDSTRTGVYPTLSILQDELGTWTHRESYSSSWLRASSTEGQSVCAREIPAAPSTLPDCSGIAEIALLPSSAALVGVRYFGDTSIAQPNGGLAVIDLSGVVLASLVYPDVEVDGVRLKVHPREVDVDPTRPIGDERFVVVFDVDIEGGMARPFVAQEFRYDATSATVTAVSAPFTTGGTVDGVTAGVETAIYDHDGNLWIAEARSNSLRGGRVVRYRRPPGRSAVGGCTVDVADIVARWASACAPDFASGVVSEFGLVRSLTEDGPRHRIVAVTIGGAVGVVSEQGSRLSMQMPLNDLIDRYRYWVGPRKGAHSADGSTLWLPIQQTRSPAVCSAAACPQVALDQWLVALNLSEL